MNSGVFFSLRKQERFTLNFCSGMPPGKVHELAFLWFGLPGPLLIFFGKRQGKPPPKKDLLSLTNPYNPWKRREERSKRQGIHRRGKKQGIPQKQGKEGQCSALYRAIGKCERDRYRGRFYRAIAFFIRCDPVHVKAITLR